MVKPALIEILHDLARPIVHSKGLEIWGIDLIQGSRPIVRVYVDLALSSLNGMDNKSLDLNENNLTHASADTSLEMQNISATISQCAEISRRLGLSMEVEEIFSSAYVLEVSTPGFSRIFFRLEQMQAYMGDTIEVSLNDFLPQSPESLQGRKKFKGILESVNVDENIFNLTIEDKKSTQIVTLPWDFVRKASRVHIFVTPEKPGKKAK